MIAMDNWSKNEYRPFITSRRDDVFENREASTVRTKRPATVELGRGDYFEQEVYFDTDVKLHWEAMVMMALRKPSMEFEFKSAPVSPILATLSKTDDVFQCSNDVYSLPTVNYKQQYPYKKQLEDDGGKTPTFVVSQRTVPEPFSQMSPGSLTRMYQPKYSKFCVNSTDVAPVETAMDSRSSSFRSQSSICESGDRDTGESSTSRDSNGSSQDASSVSTDTFDRAFDASDRTSSTTVPTSKLKGHHSLPNHTDRRPVASTNLENEKISTSLSWLRSPLKWKGIFGARKPPKSPRADPREHDHRVPPKSKLSEMSCSAASIRTDTKYAQSECPTRPLGGVIVLPESDDVQVSNMAKPFPALPNQHGTKMENLGSKLSQERKSKPFSFDTSDVQSVLSTDRERDQRGIMKIRERWLRYMKMLKPPYGKSSSKTEGVVRGDSILLSPKLLNSPPSTSTGEYVHTRAKSMPAILKTPHLRPKSNPGAVFQPSNNSITGARYIPPAGQTAKKSSLLSHSGSLVSISPRTLKSTSPKLTSKVSLSPRVKSSPKVSNSTISPRMSSSSASSMSELHSAVQGAIAHCKQSHSGLLSPTIKHHRLSSTRS